MGLSISVRLFQIYVVLSIGFVYAKLKIQVQSAKYDEAFSYLSIVYNVTLFMKEPYV